jgi:hypothetical protein
MVHLARQFVEIKSSNFQRIEYFRRMQKVLQHIYILPLFISMLLSLKSFRLSWPAPYKIFSLLLICISVIEIFALLWKYILYNNVGYGGFSNSNIWLYNCFLVPQYLLYLYVYHQVIKSKLLKRTILIAGVVYSLFTLVNILFFQSINSINSFPIIAASIIILFLTSGYFEQLRKEKEIMRLTSQPMVWISLGAFIFHAANLPYIISLNYLIHNNIPLAIALFYIYLGLNCIMYTFYSIAFLCPHPLRK